MKTVRITARVGPDGVLRFELPLGPEYASQEVLITINQSTRVKMTQTEHEEFIRATAGSWEEESQRPEQLPHQARDPL